MNNYGMLVTARNGNSVTSELHETNSKIIPLTKTIGQSLSAIVLKTINFVSLNLLIQKIELNTFCKKAFDHHSILFSGIKELETPVN